MNKMSKENYVHDVKNNFILFFAFVILKAIQA